MMTMTLLLAVVGFARGAERLTNPAALPVYDPGARVGYVGSIDPDGGNADWDWGEVQDERGEWVLFEDEGPGCIYNFTQHRTDAAEAAVFRFYFDGAEKPQLELKAKDFGRTAPFLKPVAGSFRPDFAFTIVRSFVPLEYRKSVRVTSSVRLRGRVPEGGWGHITYHKYDSDAGLATYDGTLDGAALAQRFSRPLEIPATATNALASAVTLEPGATREIFAANGAATVVRTALTLGGFEPADATNLYVLCTFDGRQTVEAPIGTFFGCECPVSRSRHETAMLTFDTSAEGRAALANRFPMPFFASARIVLANRGARRLTLASAEVRTTTALAYDPATTGYFTSSAYLPMTRNAEGRNARIGRLVGRGQLVYGTFSIYDCEKRRGTEGCEGDVRCYIDDMTVPRVLSDGSESWGSWGWGFAFPPQAQPFASYDAVGRDNHQWSQVRLLLGDAYPFRRFLRFDVEHGARNDHPESSSSGQLFAYVLPSVER